MELPIDHFRLLGVSPSSDTEEVLRFFQLRLNRTPDKGFTPEVMAQRSELLRRSADLLCDKKLREQYEVALTSGASGLDFSSNREVAGLILLWEANISSEAFYLARKALQPPQAPALGSGRESDLTLLAALACKDAALYEQEQRRYSSAAEILEEGIHLLQRMGKLSDHRQNLEKELEALLPYRILDLLSRDLSDQKSHQDGLNMLDGFVLNRGGLEGNKLSHSNIELKQADFEIFFQQIRQFLTVQEQIDLFSHWYKNGSQDAGFLHALSLVASGFCRRKPEALQKARRQINKLNLQGFDAMPLLGCIDLLLADIEQAEEFFRNSPDKDLKEWLETYPGEKLAALCDYTRNWLVRDVLPGFRDIEVDVVDLEAWFADRDVQSFVEKVERRSALGIARAGFSLISGLSSENSDSQESMREEEDVDNYFSKLDEDSTEEPVEDDNFRELSFDSVLTDFQNLISNARIPLLNFSDRASEQIGVTRNTLLLGSLVFVGLFFSGGIIAWLSIRNQLQNDNPVKPSLVQEKLDKAKSKDTTNTKSDSSLAASNKNQDIPLMLESPSLGQIQKLIEVWLQGKADILSGGSSLELNKVARTSLIKIVNQQREKDKSLGDKQIINADIQSLKIISQTKKRIEVNAKILYKDKRIKESGDVISETNIPSLTVKYILGRKKDKWELVNFSSRS